jgi:hypothetical protein
VGLTPRARRGRSTFAAGIAAALLLAASATHAQRTSFQGIAECTRLGSVQFRRHDRAFRRFVIDRASVVDEHYAGMAGNQYVATVYSGTATYETIAGARKVLFVCLHGGAERGAVFVYTVPQ